VGPDVHQSGRPERSGPSRSSGTDNKLNHAQMGTGFLTQASNKRAITLDLKTERGREILKKLVATPTSLSRTTGRAHSMRWGWVRGPVEDQSAADLRVVLGLRPGRPAARADPPTNHVIQATSGIMAMTGTKDVHPVKFGSRRSTTPPHDRCFCLSAALFQRERTARASASTCDARRAMI